MNCNRIIIHQQESVGDFIFFGKMFNRLLNHSGCVIVHESFPEIDENNICDFLNYTSEKEHIVVSGCIADVHPYRLMYIDENGFAEPYADIPQKIRGNRHLYPEVYQFIPAFVYVPCGVIFGSESMNDNMDIYVMNREKLYDKTVFPDYLYLKKNKQP